MWSVSVVILLLFCNGCLSTGNRGVYFVSKNFFNVLHWDPVKPDFPQQKVLYSVYWSGAEEQYQIKHECQNITSLSCDLTEETSSVYDVYYRAKVMVKGNCHGITTSFKPLRHTVLGPPLLSTHTAASTLHVNITPPQGPKGVSVTDIITNSKWGLLKVVLEYTLTITHPQQAAQVIKNKTAHFDIKLKYNQSVYCGHVVYIPTPEWGRSPSENASFCVTLPGNSQTPLQWLLLGAALLTGIIIISAVCMCKYVKGGQVQRKPDALVMGSNKCKVMEQQDKNLRVSDVVLSEHLAKKFPYLGQCYSAQVNTLPISSNTSAQSSVNYAKVAVQNPLKENERNFHQIGDLNGQVLQSTLHSCEEKENQARDKINPMIPYAPQQHNFNQSENNSEEQKIVLNTVRNINGQLVLNDIVLEMNREREPLITSLMVYEDEPFTFPDRQDSLDGRDSGCFDSTVNTPTSLYCNTNYPPCETMVPGFQQECQTTLAGEAIFQSGYKKNWMPDIVPGPLDIH